MERKVKLPDANDLKRIIEDILRTGRDVNIKLKNDDGDVTIYSQDVRKAYSTFTNGRKEG